MPESLPASRGKPRGRRNEGAAYSATRKTCQLWKAFPLWRVPLFDESAVSVPKQENSQSVP